MKPADLRFLVTLLLLLFDLSTYRRARGRFHWTLTACIWLFMLTGCATERATTDPKPQGVCSGQLDGSYLFINCRRIYP
jgi:hypothetical protein